ncbi:LLM class flavin-dependent oxidoreductase [Kamptonema cortianum]|nr:LLM class flavin-dependent oxidoreductase [Oscillatoria laete-virens]MDK3157373.1 LLM class flavin-dependent oxidoreductase [Kamptonema cortianum]MDL5054872.1 LLM class flavin-dependent oxidoreductase [Oscillatoria laete-virens NRMC-F 0139]
MKYGLTMPPFGPYADPKYLASIAREAEEAGWDGFFIWDHVVYDNPSHPMVDPWIGLAAIACKTTRIRIGAMITSLARRHPWKVARETVSLDILSDGRLIFGAGLGDPPERDFGTFNEPEDARIRAARLDEGLAILNGLWSGQPFSHSGEHYTVKETVFLPIAVQQPRIPIWVGGSWNKHAPMRRAARWDGFFPLKWRGMVSVDEWRDIQAYVKEQRTSDAPFDWIQGGTSPGDQRDKAADFVAQYADVGVTWWVEHIDPWRFGLGWEELMTTEVVERMNERIRQGPPRKS